MAKKINFITLAVDDFEESVQFYQKALQFTVLEQQAELCLFDLADEFQIAIQPRDELAKQSGAPSNAQGAKGIIISMAQPSRQAVDESAAQALAHGAVHAATTDKQWGYSITLRDPNGYT